MTGLVLGAGVQIKLHSRMLHDLPSPVLLPLPGGKFFKLLESFEVEGVSGRKYRVPKNFTTDLASVPGIFRILFPRTGWYTVPSIVHDWVWIMDRESASDAFEDMLLKYTPSNSMFRKMQIHVMVSAVSFWAWFKSV